MHDVDFWLEEPEELEFDLGPAVVIRTEGERYEGPYEATPTQEAQVFETEGLLMTERFAVNPIPRNYGLITYNGFYMTVS